MGYMGSVLHYPYTIWVVYGIYGQCRTCDIYRVVSHIRMRHAARVKRFCYIYECGVLHISKCCVAHINVSSRTYKGICYIYEWFVLHVSKGCVAHMNVSCCTYKRVVSQVWMRHATYIKGFCCTYECLMLYISKSFVAHMNASCCTYKRVLLHIWICSYVCCSVLQCVACCTYTHGS